MARIMIENLFEKVFEVSDHSKTLLEHFQGEYIDWMHACGGKGRCTSCKVIVKAGIHHFENLTSAEENYRQLGGLMPDERLACQARIKGDVCVLAPAEYKLPHMRYSDRE